MRWDSQFSPPTTLKQNAILIYPTLYSCFMLRLGEYWYLRGFKKEEGGRVKGTDVGILFKRRGTPLYSRVCVSNFRQVFVRRLYWVCVNIFRAGNLWEYRWTKLSTFLSGVDFNLRNQKKDNVKETHKIILLNTNIITYKTGFPYDTAS